jgi:hypothetical protein
VGTLNNNSGGLIDFQGDGTTLETDSVISNAGAIRKSSGAGTTTLHGFVTNTGTIEADSGTLDIRASAEEVNGTTLTAGTWNALNGASLVFPPGTSITTNQASITLGGKGASFPAIANLSSNTGSLSLINGASFTSAGDFSNTGSLTLGAGSSLDVVGNFTQGASQPLTFDIGGTPASGDFGQLNATGTATLAGSISASFVNGFSPTAGNNYSIVTYASQTGGSNIT